MSHTCTRVHSCNAVLDTENALIMLHKTSKQNKTKNKLLLHVILVVAMFTVLNFSDYEPYYCIKRDTGFKTQQ